MRRVILSIFGCLIFSLKVTGMWVNCVYVMYITHQTHRHTQLVSTHGIILVLWARAQTYSPTWTLGPHFVMIPMVNKKDLTWVITDSKCVCDIKRERERPWAVIASSSQSSDVLSLIDDVCEVVSINIYITDKVLGMIHVVCVLCVSMHRL